MDCQTKGRPLKYEVIVSDHGTMYKGTDYPEALHIYMDYALRSGASYGRMSGKHVTLINREIIKQHDARKTTGDRQ